MGDASYGLVLPFDTDDPVFAHGIEAGVLWHRLSVEDDEVEAVVHTANAEMVLRMGEATGRDVWSEELGEPWLSVTFASKEQNSES